MADCPPQCNCSQLIRWFLYLLDMFARFAFCSCLATLGSYPCRTNYVCLAQQNLDTEGGNGSEAANTRDWWTKGVSVDGRMS